MDRPIQPIETTYKGYRFRSRLEARWGVYFDALSIKWEYEPEGYNLGGGLLYLPDFWLPQVDLWGEVKPLAFTFSEMDKVKKLVRLTNKGCLLLVGTPDHVVYGKLEPYSPDGMEEIFLNDCIISDEYLDENRFYSSTAHKIGFHLGKAEGSVEKAINAARSARFEHGEKP